MQMKHAEESNKIGASVRRSSGRRSGGRLLAMTQWPLFSSVFSFFFPVFFPFFFFSRFSSVATFSHRRSARIKKLIQQKLTGTQKSRGRDLSRPRRPFWGPIVVILDLAGGDRVPLPPLGWYFLPQSRSTPAYYNDVIMCCCCCCYQVLYQLYPGVLPLPSYVLRVNYPGQSGQVLNYLLQLETSTTKVV